MTRDDIIRMADENGIVIVGEAMFRFAALVAAEVAKCGGCGKAGAEGWALYCVSCCEQSMVKAAIAEEREACALVVENCCSYCAERIRERGEEPKRHPGYIIGDHWLQAAYTRVCTGETEDEVMTDYGWQRVRGEK